MSQGTQEAQRDLNNPHTKIALVGCFQVGKSTLLNQAFLGEELLLRQGDGRCTTAVMTKVMYGPQKRLTVVYRDMQRAREVFQGDEVTQELIARLTTVDEPDEAERQKKRTEMAQTIQYIQIEYPCEALRRYTFYDTPGIDDPNRELIELTTFQFLPETDLVILVVDASTALNTYVLQFLSRSVFQEGIGRVMVMASYRPAHDQSAESRSLILQSIRAELANIGRGYIPVVSYTFDSDVDGEILHGGSEIQPTVLEYTDKNRRLAREERLAWFLRNDLLAEREKIKASLLTSFQTERERDELKLKIDEMSRMLDFDYQKTLDNFRVSCLQVKSWLGVEIQSKLLDDGNPGSILSRFMAEFDECVDLAEVRNRIDVATETIRPDVDYTILQIIQETQKRTESALATASEIVRESIQKCRISTQWDGGVSTGWTGKITPMLIRVAELAFGYILFHFPGFLVTVFGKNIPLLKNLLPTIFMKTIVLTSIKDSFSRGMESVRKDIFLQFDSSQESIESEIKTVFQNIYNVQVSPYLEKLESDLIPLSQDEQHEMETKVQQYNQVTENLNIF
ncbi:MAG: dynamin family protein [Planctomycetia bacterium]|nr:dynamin family protein [Planctomycetia bacterium]